MTFSRDNTSSFVNFEEDKMNQPSKHAGNLVMLRGACLWILMALLLAWCLVGLYNNIEFLKAIFPGSTTRVLQAHLDFLIMSALILGFYAAKVSLPWHVRWAMVIGAFTNSSLFLMYAIFPVLDPLHEAFNPVGLGPSIFNIYLYTSLLITSYGFGKGAVIILKSTFSDND